MRLRLKAIRSLRWNYRWRGVWVWLKGRAVRRCTLCAGDGEIRLGEALVDCFWCDGAGKIFGRRGYQRILSEPQRVIDEQTAAAEGVFV